MYAVTNRIPVPAAGAAAFGEGFPASVRGTLPDVPNLAGARPLRPQQAGEAYVPVLDVTSADAFAAWLRSPSFHAAHGLSIATGGAETAETVVSVGA
jgi:heme-degrading monooxygenase HmoA